MSGRQAEGSLTNAVFVGDLPRSIDEQTIRSIFESCGQIQEITIKQQQRGTATAIVTFLTHDQAQAAINECNYTKLDNHPIHVMWRETGTRRERVANSNLVITNLPASVEEPQLHEALTQYGAIVAVRIARNPRGEPTGLAYVQFDNAADAASARQALQNAEIEGQLINVDFFKPPEERKNIPTKLPNSVLCVETATKSLLSQDNLRSLFGRFGEVIETLIFEETFGIVMFATATDCHTAQVEFHDSRLQVLTTVRKEIQVAVLRLMESRRVYVSDMTVKDRDGLLEVLSRAGRVVQLELGSHGPETVAVAQFETNDTRNLAVRTLSGSTFGEQVTPIRVFPWYDKRLEHPASGLLQLNELEASVTSGDLRLRLSEFGNISAVSVVATEHGLLVGYVLLRVTHRPKWRPGSAEL
jgi:RNA recognition motif-containing protein